MDTTKTQKMRVFAEMLDSPHQSVLAALMQSFEDFDAAFAASPSLTLPGEDALRELSFQACSTGDCDIILILDEMIAQARANQATLRRKGPLCPFCKTVMERALYKGYYDTFSAWICECGDDIEATTTLSGSYA